LRLASRKDNVHNIIFDFLVNIDLIDGGPRPENIIRRNQLIDRNRRAGRGRAGAVGAP
jgi:hypothetical protein